MSLYPYPSFVSFGFFFLFGFLFLYWVETVPSCFDPFYGTAAPPAGWCSKTWDDSACLLCLPVEVLLFLAIVSGSFYKSLKTSRMIPYSNFLHVNRLLSFFASPAPRQHANERVVCLTRIHWDIPVLGCSALSSLGGGVSTNSCFVYTIVGLLAGGLFD